MNLTKSKCTMQGCILYHNITSEVWVWKGSFFDKYFRFSHFTVAATKSFFIFTKMSSFKWQVNKIFWEAVLTSCEGRSAALCGVCSLWCAGCISIIAKLNWSSKYWKGSWFHQLFPLTYNAFITYLAELLNCLIRLEPFI